MVYYVKGNLLDSNCDYICHQVNCQGRMGSGIAKQIRERWPEVYEGYKHFCEYHASKGESPLGKILVTHKQCPMCVINMFSQDNYGYDGERYTSYDAFAHCLEIIREHTTHNDTIGFPKNIGCGLGGGNWRVISALIEEIVGDCRDVYIYELE